MSAIVAGVDKFGDLMRMAISTPGNDFRLGAMEAPPAVISTYLGEDMTSYLKKFMENGDVGEYVAGSRDINLGLDYLPTVFVSPTSTALSVCAVHEILPRTQRSL